MWTKEQITGRIKMNYTRVKVTKEDIAAGVTGDEYRCPVANCINRYAQNKSCRVLQEKVILNGQGVTHNLLTFLKILFYDTFGKMSPFYIKVPSNWISKSDLISKSEIKSYKLTTPSEIYHPLIGLKSEKAYQ